MSGVGGVPARPTGIALVAWAFLAATSAWVLTVGGTYGGITAAPARIVTHLLAGLVLGGWAVAAIRSPALRPRPQLVLASLPALIAFALAVAASERPRLSLEAGTAGLTAAVAGFAALGLARVPVLRIRFAVLFVGLAAAVSVGYIVEVVREWIEWWGLIGGLAIPPLRPSFVSLTLGSPNLIATYLVLIGPLAAVLATRRFGFLAAGFLTAAMLVAVFLSGSRGGWLAAAVTVGVFVLLAARHRIGGLGNRFLKRDGRIRPLPMLVLAAGGAGIALVGTRLAAGRLDLADDIRSTFWRTAWDLFLRDPLTGVGPGAWPQLRFEFGSTDEFAIAVAHAHDFYLHTLAEVGLLGAIGVGLLGAAVGWRLIGALRSSTPAAGPAAAVIASLLGFGAQNLVDNLLNLPAVVLLCIFLVAWVDGDPELAKASGREHAATSSLRARASRAAGAIVATSVAVLVASTPATIASDRAGLAIARGNAAADGDDWQAALASYDEAAELDGDLALVAILRGNALAHLGRTGEALDAYRVAVPEDLVPENRIALALLEEAAGDPAAAVREARIAFERGGATSVIALNAGLVFERAGDGAAAAEAYALAARTNPAILAAAFWDARPDGLDRATIARRVADGYVAAGAWQEAALTSAYGGDDATARAQIANAPPGQEREAIAAAIDWLSDDPDAIATLEARLDADPDDFFAAAWLARILLAEGRTDEAERLRSWALAVRADQAESIVYQYSVIPAADDERGLSRPLHYPDVIYLRMGPFDILPPQVVTIGVATGRTIAVSGSRGGNE